MNLPILEAKNLAFSYQQRPVLTDISCELRTGELVGLLGINGSGKTTLLHLLSGILTSQSGQVLLEQTPLCELTRRDIAKKLALVPQDSTLELSFPVRDIVAMGRNPYLGKLSPETDKDREAVRRAMELTDLASLVKRPINELSGGERKRVFIARSLAQETSILLLDEPTANLDLSHQLQVLSLLKDLSRQEKSVIISIHNLSLAARYCDRILLLSSTKLAAQGRPADVLTEESLKKLFKVHAKIEVIQGIPNITPIEPC